MSGDLRSKEMFFAMQRLTSSSPPKKALARVLFCGKRDSAFIQADITSSFQFICYNIYLKSSCLYVTIKTYNIWN